MKSENRDAKLIFGEALRLGVPAERAAYLDQTCAEDLELRQEVESLLSAHAQAGDFLNQTRPFPAPDPLIEHAGTRIGRYKLLEQIGEGGFGVVWMAEQEEPLRRRVALKIIKLGMDTKEVVARFEAERQALAIMDHPNIARVFDGGATDTGRPFFVMELVKGVPITEYCDANKLPTRERLALFAQVCQAVQHAHQKGVIHRDLKPSNVLVTVQDDKAVPKVIDFGVAKATQVRLTQKTVFTRFQQWIGTPAYMSPEQAGLGSLDVDTRSDIYSLGVLLYELLTGRTPFDTEKLLAAGYDAVMRAIREQEPPKPSTRLSTFTAEELSAVAAKRKAEPAKLGGLLRGDLDWIVMKALEKDRSRRYETANNVAMDIMRHLQGEPVSAAAPTALYLAQKFVRRHRTGLATAAALALLLAVGTVISAWQALRATRAERAARENALKAMAEAARSQQTARLFKEMLGTVPTVHYLRDPQNEGLAPARDTRLLRQNLDRTADKVMRDWEDQPALAAEFQGGIAQAYFALGDYAKAEAVNRRVLATLKALPGDHGEDVVGTLDNLATALRAQNKPAESILVQRESLAARRKMLGADRPELIGPLHDLGWALYLHREYREAEGLFREGVALVKSHPGERGWAADRLPGSLVCALREQGNFAEAESLCREGLQYARKLTPPDERAVGGALAGLILTMLCQNKFVEAEPLAREQLAITERFYTNHWYRFWGESALGACLLGQKKYAEAEPLLEAGYQGLKQRYDKYTVYYKARDLRMALNRLIQLCEETGQNAKAARLKQELANFEKREGGPPPGPGAPP